MKLAVSNIAWPADHDIEVADLLQSSVVEGIEVAPTRIWPAPLDASPSEVKAHRGWWEERGLPIIAAQALLFGQPELTVFESGEIRRRTIAYLEGIIEVCADLGAKVLVFGSPKNRRVGALSSETVEGIAVDFFGRLGEAASRAGAALVMEANPPAYGADYITSASAALDLVRKVNHPGFRLHLDSGCMTMSRDPVEEILGGAADVLSHFHISEPHLAPIGEGGVDHEFFGRLLNGSAYDRWVSIEMRLTEPFNIGDIERAVSTAEAAYISPLLTLQTG